MSGDEWTINSDHTLECYIDHVRKTYDEHKYFRSKLATGKIRTNPQNAALHVYLDKLATALSDAGLDMREVLSEDIELPPTAILVKECIWRRVQKALIGEKKTSKAETDQYNIIYESINRHTAQTWGISIPWPCKDEQ